MVTSMPLGSFLGNLRLWRKPKPDEADELRIQQLFSLDSAE